MIDIASDNRVSLTLSDAALAPSAAPGSGCVIGKEGSMSGGDPEWGACARLVLSGTLLNISGTDEEAIAKDVLFSRHPAMPGWPADHSWFFGKIDISDIR